MDRLTRFGSKVVVVRDEKSCWEWVGASAIRPLPFTQRSRERRYVLDRSDKALIFVVGEPVLHAFLLPIRECALPKRAASAATVRHGACDFDFDRLRSGPLRGQQPEKPPALPGGSLHRR